MQNIAPIRRRKIKTTFNFVNISFITQNLKNKKITKEKSIKTENKCNEINIREKMKKRNKS